jgi:hypothetical protein
MAANFGVDMWRFGAHRSSGLTSSFHLPDKAAIIADSLPQTFSWFYT